MTIAIQTIGIDKRFGPVHANCSVDLSVKSGSIHGIVGENGAGKSTLMCILYGFYQADSGTIEVVGKPTTIRSSREALALGIGMVHQHFMLVDTLSVIDNVMLGAEGGVFLAGGAGRARSQLAKLGRDYGLTIDPDALVGALPVGMQQRVEILKCLLRGANILILDEPTAVLTPMEADQLFDIMRVLRAEGKTVLLVTHKLREILAVTDRVSVMRQGAMVAHYDTNSTSAAELAQAMVGRKVLLRVQKEMAQPGAIVMEARGLGVRDARGLALLSDANLQLRAGEILGIAGVSGNGQSQLLDALAGLLPISSGSIYFEGAALGEKALHSRHLRQLGIMHVPEDRQRRGLVMSFEGCESAMLGYQSDAMFGKLLLDKKAIAADCATKMSDFDVRPIAPRLKTANFSGGNQQKIVLAREMARDPKVLLIGQPTRGVDIGAIEFIHKRLIALRDHGKAVLLVSVELDEILALSDRILVMFGGRIIGERTPQNTNATDIGLLMAGVSERAA